VIYFAQLPGGSIKIGTSENIELRLSGLADHYGAELALLATMPGDRSIEAEIHERFSHLRLGRTEQFRPAADLMAFIGKPLLVGINPDAVEAFQGEPKGTQPNAITIRGSAEWKDWLDRFASRMRIKPTAIIDLALAKLAEQERFSEPPPRM
jgi:hypothetical protein